MNPPHANAPAPSEFRLDWSRLAHAEDAAPPRRKNLQKHLAAVNEKKILCRAAFGKDLLPFGGGLERGHIGKRSAGRRA